MLEVQLRGPVVGEVLRHLAGGAGGLLADVAGHGGVEGVSTDDVVDVGGGASHQAGQQGRGAGPSGSSMEAQAGVGNADEGGGGEQLHLGGAWTGRQKCVHR